MTEEENLECISIHMKILVERDKELPDSSMFGELTPEKSITSIQLANKDWYTRQRILKVSENNWVNGNPYISIEIFFFFLIKCCFTFTHLSN